MNDDNSSSEVLNNCAQLHNFNLTFWPSEGIQTLHILAGVFTWKHPCFVFSKFFLMLYEKVEVYDSNKSAMICDNSWCFDSIQDREMIAERQAALRQLETILTFHKLARNGKYSDALVELSKLSFLPLDNWKYDLGTDSLQNVQPSVKACIPELLKVALSCLDNIPDVDGSIRRMRGKVSTIDDSTFFL
jgi:hypothetical protein